MTWRPLVRDADARARVRAIIDAIVAALDPDTANVTELLHYSLVRSYLATDDTVPDPDDVSGDALARAVAGFDSTTGGLAIYGGVAGLGWMLAHLATGDDVETACREIDHALEALLHSPWQREYDLLEGLVGFGVYATERGELGRPLAIRVLDHLERLARPREAGLAWHTAPELLPAWQRAQEPAGYWNLGMAHGIAGVIALLARYVVADWERARARALLDGAIAYLISIDRESDGGRYPAWQPASSVDLVFTNGYGPDGAPLGRLAWCYGDLGVAIAMLAAADAVGDPAWRARAVSVARACASRDGEAAFVMDAGICHGGAGAVQLFNRLHQATGELVFADAAERWLERTIAMRMDHPIAGFPRLARRPDGPDEWRADASLLTGVVGVALVLHAVISETEPRWDRLLLMS